MDRRYRSSLVDQSPKPNLRVTQGPYREPGSVYRRRKNNELFDGCDSLREEIKREHRFIVLTLLLCFAVLVSMLLLGYVAKQ